MSGGAGTPAVNGTPQIEPVTLAQAKLHLRLITDPADVSAHPDDAMIAGQITGARVWCEHYCGRALVAGTHEAEGAWFDLPLLVPAASVTSVLYTDPDGAEQTLPDTVYRLQSASLSAGLRLKGGQTWPNICRDDAAVRVVYVTEAAADDVLAVVIPAMLLLIGMLYTNRQEVIAEYRVKPEQLPMGIKALLSAVEIPVV